jgi:hypothetical protein
MTDSTGPKQMRSLSRVQITQDIVAAVMSAAIIGTATGVLWLVTSLPNRLQQIEQRMGQMLKSQELYGEKVTEIEKTVNEHDRRIIRLELTK